MLRNSAQYGGGTYYCTLNNCTLAGNLAGQSGGGDFYGILNNCIVYFNWAGLSDTNYYGSTLEYCCTTPLPTAGTGNITDDPLFADTNGWANLRLHADSPCINAGLNDYAPGLTDLDGRSRIVGGAVDMGAYEFQPSASSAFIGWLGSYGLPTDGSVDSTDSDADLMDNWQEWEADTNPTNTASVFRIATISTGPPVAVAFSSSAARLYTLLVCADLATAAWTPVPGQIDIPGNDDMLTLTDTNPPTPAFYRVSVRMP